MHEFVILGLHRTIAISSSQVGHHTTACSIASSSHVPTLRYHLFPEITDTVALVSSIISVQIRWWLHTVLSDRSLRVKRDLVMLRRLWSIESICSLLRHVHDLGVVMSLLHVN